MVIVCSVCSPAGDKIPTQRTLPLSFAHFLVTCCFPVCVCVLMSLNVVIVCSVCSPAGDKIPGDGVSRTHTLKDLRIPLPALGIPPTT